MELFERAKEFLYTLATLGPLSYHRFGSYAATLLAFPVFSIGRLCYRFSPDLFYNLLIVKIILVGTALSFVMRSLPFDKHDQMLITRALGMMVSLYYIPYRPMLLLVALCLFNIVRWLISSPSLLKQPVNFGSAPGIWGLVGNDIFAGIVTNLIMHVLRFIA